MKVLCFAGLVVGLMATAPRSAEPQAAHKPAMRTGATAAKASPQGKVHIYYIAADEVQWNYMPTPTVYLLHGEEEIIGGPPPKTNTYTKAVYHEYTDDTFKTLKPRSPEWEHMGILGPLIRAEVGDTIKVFFKNNTHLNTTIHAHGLEYDKDSEGAYYAESGGGAPDPNRQGNVVRSGERFTYLWSVPERAGPGPMDPDSILWMYHSHFNESRDMNSGLVGPMIISRRGTTKADGTPKGVDREFVVSFGIFNETGSGFFMKNAVRDQKYSASELSNPSLPKTLEYYTMNGYIKGTMPMPVMKKGEHVRWYLMANGSEDDVHAPHWHGQTVLANNMRMDTLSLGPMAMMVADMVPDNPGTWLFHCHVNDHFDNGMYALFKVLP